jgi:putative ABC transport system substrate-binding protein
LAAPLAVEAQQPAKIYRIGYLAAGFRADSTGGLETDPHQCPIRAGIYWQAFVEGLRELGYIRGQNLIIECRSIEGREERAPALAAELLRLKPDLIVAVTAANVLAAKQATSTIPIVMTGIGNPGTLGLVASLARPGGNVTGLTNMIGAEIMGKRLQILKEAVPRVSRVAKLSDLTGVPCQECRREEEAAAQALGLTLQQYGVRAPEELEGAFTAMTKARAEALYGAPGNSFWVHRQRIVTLAAKSRLPAIYAHRDYAVDGGLLAYAADEAASYRRVGVYADKIFKGANPGDLPVEQPTKFELFINLKAAKALGLTIPQSLLIQAEKVIQ